MLNPKWFRFYTYNDISCSNGTWGLFEEKLFHTFQKGIFYRLKMKHQTIKSIYIFMYQFRDNFCTQCAFLVTILLSKRYHLRTESNFFDMISEQKGMSNFLKRYWLWGTKRPTRHRIFTSSSRKDNDTSSPKIVTYFLWNDNLLA